MAIKKVTAIVRADMLNAIEQHLREIHVAGMSVMTVKGYGEYRDYFSRDHKTEHARIEIFAEEEEADRIAVAITERARTGGPGDGIVVVLPVERATRIRDGRPMGTARSRERPAPLPPPGTAWMTVYYALLVLVAICVGALFVVGMQHRLHALVAGFAAILLISALLGLPLLWRWGSGDHESR